MDRIIDDVILTDIADAVREKTGETDLIVPENMPQKVTECYDAGYNKAKAEWMEFEDAIIERTISGEYVNDRITMIGSSIFRDCPYITSISCANVTSVAARAMYSCSRLKTVNLPNVTHFSDYAIYSCGSITSVYLPKLETTASQAMARMSDIKKIELPAIKTISSTCFDRCSALTALILPGSTVATLQGTAFTNTPIASGDGYIYVPSALVEEYKATTNWSTYADQIRAIEDYPDIAGGDA